MGAYTEVFLRTKLKCNLNSDIESVFSFLFNNGDKPALIPEHAFFDCCNWHKFGRCSYSNFQTFSYINEGYLCSRFDVKVVDQDIDKFFDWIEPYIDKNEQDSICIGWYWSEKEPQPELVFM